MSDRNLKRDGADPERTWDLAVKHAREVIAQKQRAIDAMRRAVYQPKAEKGVS